MARKKKKQAPNWRRWAVGGVAAVAIAVAAAANHPYFIGELVTEVIDGDSFKIANKQTIRLAGLNAPENEYCMGKEATQALTKKILGKRVFLRDVKTDIFRRILALVYVDGELVNAYMVQNGLAVSSRQGGSENNTLIGANDYARSKKIGVFSPQCYQPNPPDPKCPIKGNIDDRTKEKQYLLPDCRHYEKVIIERNTDESYFCTEKEAQTAGYTKSCDPRMP